MCIKIEQDSEVPYFLEKSSKNLLLKKVLVETSIKVTLKYPTLLVHNVLHQGV